MGETCQNDVRERMGGGGSGRRADLSYSPRNGEANCIRLRMCRFSTFDVSLSHATKKMNLTFLLSWKVLLRINE